jgi:hypothetical protein
LKKYTEVDEDGAYLSERGMLELNKLNRDFIREGGLESDIPMGNIGPKIIRPSPSNVGPLPSSSKFFESIFRDGDIVPRKYSYGTCYELFDLNKLSFIALNEESFKEHYRPSARDN